MAIYINTNQNVQINYEISSVSDRILAYLIDALVIVGISIVMVFIAFITKIEILSYLFILLIFFYHLICEITMNGQSIGKRYRGIRVMKKDGNAATLSSYLLRFLLRPIDSIYGLGLAIIFFTNKNQRLGDLAAGTIVVKLKTEEELKEQIRLEMNTHRHDDIKYSEAGTLTDQDIQIIKAILNNRVKTRSHKNIHQLATKISNKLGVKLGEVDSYTFLERVVGDYYQIHSS